MPGVGGGRAAGGNPRRGGAEAQPEEPRKQRAEVVPEAFQKLQVMRRGRLEAGKGAGKRGRQGGRGKGIRDACGRVRRGIHRSSEDAGGAR